jgi:hypothetical protein
MSDDELRVLKKYLDDAQALDDQFDKEELTRIHWLIKKGYLVTCLQESAPRVHIALQYGQVALLHWSAFTSEQRELFDRLQREDQTAFRAWRYDYLRRNLYWAAKNVLALYDGIELPPLPAPSEAPPTRPSQVAQID